MDQEVQHLNMPHQLNKELQHYGENHSTEGSIVTSEKTCSDHEYDTDVSKTGTDDCSTDVGDELPTKFSFYPNGATRLTDTAITTYKKSNHNCEQSITELNMAGSGLSSTTQQAVDGSPLQLDACNNKGEIEIDIDPKHGSTNQVTPHRLSITEEPVKSSSDSKDDTELPVTDDSDKATEIAGDASVNVNGCAEMPHMDSVICKDKLQQNDKRVDSLQPLDFSVSGSAKAGVCTSGKPAETSRADDGQKTYPKHSVKSDNCYRPVGRLLHDLGLELVREQVYRDLIDIQTVKDTKNRLEEREKGQLLKLIEAQERLAARNTPYQLPTKRCIRCGFMSSSTNVMTLHHEFGTVSRNDATMHVCCLCTGVPGYRSRNAAQFMEHLSTDHGLTGRLMKKAAPYACKNCLFEHKSSVRLTVHVEKCAKKFSLTTNLQPLPGDYDIPLMYRPSDRKQMGTSAYTPSNTLSNASLSGSGPPSVRTLLSSLRHQLSASNQGSSNNELVMPSLICEICGKLVDGREALWGHFRSTHHVELCRTTMRDKEPWMKCDVCSGRFWTYQGLSRHLLLAHNRALASSFASGPPVTPVTPAVARCHICGGSQTSNPLSHFSAYHNVTLLEMYHAKLCCICNRKVNSGRAFEEHMVEQHSDIFANYDVLRTVLQALTTARYFKADDTREPTTQHIMQLSARGGQSSDNYSVAKKKFTGSALNATAGGYRNYTATGMTDKTSVMSASGSSQTVQRKPNSSSIVSPQNAQRKMSNTNSSVMKHKFTTSASLCAKKKRMSVPETQISAVKASDKGATAEEVKRLYEDLADIGRPILRSMRRSHSTKSEVNRVESKESITEASLQNDSINTEEVPAKKVHLQSTDTVCDDKINNTV